MVLLRPQLQLLLRGIPPDEQSTSGIFLLVSFPRLYAETETDPPDDGRRLR